MISIDAQVLEEYENKQDLSLKIYHLKCTTSKINLFNHFFSECHCNDEGSVNHICKKKDDAGQGDVGQCTCKSDLITGRQCDKSIDGYWGFPNPKGEYFGFLNFFVYIIS